MARPSGLKAIIILELFVGILGMATGSTLLADPSGKSVGLDVALHRLPLSDFTLLGASLFLVYGVLPVLLALGLWIGRRWAWTAALVLAFLEIVWVVEQTYWVALYLWQGIIGTIAVATIFLLYRTSVKAYFGK